MPSHYGNLGRLSLGGNDDEFNKFKFDLAGTNTGFANSAALPPPVAPTSLASINLNKKLGPGAGTRVPPISKDSGFGFNLDTFNLGGNILGGLGKLASGYAAIKGLGLAKKQLQQGQAQFEQNFAEQQRATGDNRRIANNEIRGRQNFIAKTHANPDFSYLKTLTV